MKAFSTAARAELSHIWPSAECCARAELAGMLRASGSLHLLGSGRLSVSVRTEHAGVARIIIRLLRRVSKLPAELLVEERDHLRRRRFYRIRLAASQQVKKLLIELGLMGEEGRSESAVPAWLVRENCCRAAFLRGAYMLRGSVSDPRGGDYHLEIVAATEEFGLGLCYLLNMVRFKAHLNERKGQYVVYLKDADDIAGFLTFIGAQAARLELEEVRVVKEVREGVNRLVNAETANVSKSVAAAIEQIEAIQALQRAGVLERLQDSLRELALTRLNHPEASMTELGQMLRPPASKSAVNHRMRKLRRYAVEIGFRHAEDSVPPGS